MIDLDEPLNKKDVTSEITGQTFNLDEEPQQQTLDETQQPDSAPAELHPFCGIIDMLIFSSQEPLAKYGYPAPNLSIWNEWGKPNLSKAFYQYLPLDSAAGAAVSSPAFAGVLGFASLVIAFLPVIMHHLAKKRAEEAQAKQEAEAQQTAKPQPQQNPAPTPEPVRASAPDKRPKNRIQTPDNIEPKLVKLPGGGADAPAVPMMELIAKNMGADPQPI